MRKSGDIQIRFGRRVLELRKAKGLSQEDLAAECGLDRTYISGIERGRRNISLLSIEAVAKGLGTSISDLFEGM